VIQQERAASAAETGFAMSMWWLLTIAEQIRDRLFAIAAELDSHP
jgi:hypothetical protein